MIHQAETSPDETLEKISKPTWTTWSSCCSVDQGCTHQWVCPLFCCSDIRGEVAGNVLRHHADLRGSVHLRRNQRLPVHLLQVRPSALPVPSCSDAALFWLLMGCVTCLPAGCVSLEPERVTCPACWPWSIIRTARPSLLCWSAYVQPHIGVILNSSFRCNIQYFFKLFHLWPIVSLVSVNPGRTVKDMSDGVGNPILL